MTSHTPAPGPDTPETTAGPGQASAADLLKGAALPAATATAGALGPKIAMYAMTDTMTSSDELSARLAGLTSPGPGPARPRGRRAAALLAAAAPLAAAALASSPLAMASAAAPPAASTARPGQALAAELLATGTLPATTAGTGGTDPKIPTMVGD